MYLGHLDCKVLPLALPIVDCLLLPSPTVLPFLPLSTTDCRVIFVHRPPSKHIDVVDSFFVATAVLCIVHRHELILTFNSIEHGLGKFQLPVESAPCSQPYCSSFEMSTDSKTCHHLAMRHAWAPITILFSIKALYVFYRPHQHPVSLLSHSPTFLYSSRKPFFRLF